MRGILKRAALALLTAGVAGLSYTATAQEAVPLEPVPSLPPPVTTTEFVMPGVATSIPQSTTPEQAPPTTQNYPTARKPRKPRLAVFGADQTGIPNDLLAVPTVPSSWAVDTLPTATPQSLPSAGLATELHDTARVQHLETAVIPVPVQPLLTPAAAAEAAAQHEMQASPTKPAPNWAAQRSAAAVKTNDWPAAFVEHDRSHNTTSKPVAMVEPVKLETAVPQSSVPNLPTQLQQEVARTCGNLARDVKVVVQPDHGIAIRVQAVNASAERELLERLLKLPALGEPNVHLEFDTTR